MDGKNPTEKEPPSCSCGIIQKPTLSPNSHVNLFRNYLLRQNILCGLGPVCLHKNAWVVYMLQERALLGKLTQSLHKCPCPAGSSGYSG